MTTNSTKYRLISGLWEGGINEGIGTPEGGRFRDLETPTTSAASILEIEVSAAMEHGWTPLGGPVMIPLSDAAILRVMTAHGVSEAEANATIRRMQTVGLVIQAVVR